MKTLLTNLLTALCLVLLAQSFLMPAAHAYLDPGTGQFIIQTLFGMGLGAAVALARFKKQVLDFFNRNKQKVESEQAAAQVDSSDQ